MLLQKSFKIRMYRLATNEFYTTKFPDFPLLSCFFFFKEFHDFFLLASKFPDISRFSRSLELSATAR